MNWLRNYPQGNVPKKQNGVALITALIITTIAVSLAGTVMYRQQLQIRLSSNISHLEQAYMYVYGMEDWAGTILTQSWKDHPNYDSLEDDWYAKGQLITFPIDGGTLNGQLIDLQSRINVNLLVRDKPLPPPPPVQGQPIPEPKPDIASIIRTSLQRLIEQEIDPNGELDPPSYFTDILKDWIDVDNKNGNISTVAADGESGNGAESDYYQSLEPAYFGANTLMVSPTELRLLKDLKKEQYTKLLEYVSTLPIERSNNNPTKTKINVNTASTQVLDAVGFFKEDIDEIIERRKTNPFVTIDDVKAVASQSFANNENIEPIIDIKTDYFLLKGRVTIINASIPVNSILHRDRQNGKISVIMRDFSVQ